MTAHHEIHLESYIVKKLVENKWVEGNNTQRSEHAAAREALMPFKTNLGRFVRTYNYIAQLIERGDIEY